MNKALYNSMFSLFHHDVGYKNDLFDFKTENLLLLPKSTSSLKIENIADILFSIVTNSIGNLKDSEISLTLTGGMDSRLILACLLKGGIKPNCITYGNSKSNDVINSKKLAKNLSLKLHNPSSILPSKDWYYKWVLATIIQDNGNSHLHRAHRTAAIAEHMEQYHPKLLFTGHMGGEGLRGLTYNNYFSSKFFEWVNEGKMPAIKAILKILDDCFLRKENINLVELEYHVMQLPWMKHDKETNKFYFLYDLVAKIHHAQDIRIYKSYIPNVIPVYLHKLYLDAIFSSPYNCLSRGNGVFQRLQNPYIYCKAIEYLFPKLLEYPFTNNFTPKEYLKSLWYYLPVKLYRDYKKKNKFPQTFSYGKWYVDFVKEHATNIDPEIWEIYDKTKYFKALNNNEHKTEEGYWHKFSNPVYFDLLNKYKYGKLT